jgi:hypothetical protein
MWIWFTEFGSPAQGSISVRGFSRRSRQNVRKLIAFDDDTFAKLKHLARDRMATVQELADEAFADLLSKHGVPVDLKQALRKSAEISELPARKVAVPSPKKPRS